jgi:hypothetical protein
LRGIENAAFRIKCQWKIHQVDFDLRIAKGIAENSPQCHEENPILLPTQSLSSRIEYPGFTNGESGWSITSDVHFENGTALPEETAGSQTRLNQVFVVGENDHALTFTLVNLNLDDADTGLCLLSGIGLTKTEGVATVENPDGSLTVTVDLSHIPAGTVANRAFDLIGFGKGAAAPQPWSCSKRRRATASRECA